MSYTFSISAIKRILAHLYTCYTEPENVEARTQMAIAATEAGVAFNNASVTIIHGMSRPIGALFHVPHGLSNAMIMLECLRYVVDGAYPEFAAVAREVGASVAADDKVAICSMLLPSCCESSISLRLPAMASMSMNSVHRFPRWQRTLSIRAVRQIRSSL